MQGWGEHFSISPPNNSPFSGMGEQGFVLCCLGSCCTGVLCLLLGSNPVLAVSRMGLDSRDVGMEPGSLWEPRAHPSEPPWALFPNSEALEWPAAGAVPSFPAVGAGGARLCPPGSGCRDVRMSGQGCSWSSRSLQDRRMSPALPEEHIGDFCCSLCFQKAVCHKSELFCLQEGNEPGEEEHGACSEGGEWIGH